MQLKQTSNVWNVRKVGFKICIKLYETTDQCLVGFDYSNTIYEGDTPLPPCVLRTALFWHCVLRTAIFWPRVLRTV